LESYVGSIQVEDASGYRFAVHEYQRRRWFTRTIRHVLDSGELVRRVNETHFVVVATGETLLRADAD